MLKQNPKKTQVIKTSDEYILAETKKYQMNVIGICQWHLEADDKLIKLLKVEIGKSENEKELSDKDIQLKLNIKQAESTQEGVKFIRQWKTLRCEIMKDIETESVSEIASIIKIIQVHKDKIKKDEASLKVAKSNVMAKGLAAVVGVLGVGGFNNADKLLEEKKIGYAEFNTFKLHMETINKEGFDRELTIPILIQQINQKNDKELQILLNQLQEKIKNGAKDSVRVVKEFLTVDKMRQLAEIHTQMTAYSVDQAVLDFKRLEFADLTTSIRSLDMQSLQSYPYTGARNYARGAKVCIPYPDWGEASTKAKKEWNSNQARRRTKWIPKNLETASVGWYIAQLYKKSNGLCLIRKLFRVQENNELSKPLKNETYEIVPSSLVLEIVNKNNQYVIPEMGLDSEMGLGLNDLAFITGRCQWGKIMKSEEERPSDFISNSYNALCHELFTAENKKTYEKNILFKTNMKKWIKTLLGDVIITTNEEGKYDISVKIVKDNGEQETVFLEKNIYLSTTWKMSNQIWKFWGKWADGTQAQKTWTANMTEMPNYDSRLERYPVWTKLAMEKLVLTGVNAQKMPVFGTHGPNALKWVRDMVKDFDSSVLTAPSANDNIKQILVDKISLKQKFEKHHRVDQNTAVRLKKKLAIFDAVYTKWRTRELMWLKSKETDEETGEIIENKYFELTDGTETINTDHVVHVDYKINVNDNENENGVPKEYTFDIWKNDVKYKPVKSPTTAPENEKEEWTQKTIDAEVAFENYFFTAKSVVNMEISNPMQKIMEAFTNPGSLQYLDLNGPTHVVYVLPDFVQGKNPNMKKVIVRDGLNMNERMIASSYGFGYDNEENRRSGMEHIMRSQMQMTMQSTLAKATNTNPMEQNPPIFVPANSLTPMSWKVSLGVGIEWVWDMLPIDWQRYIVENIWDGLTNLLLGTKSVLGTMLEQKYLCMGALAMIAYCIDLFDTNIIDKIKDLFTALDVTEQFERIKQIIKKKTSKTLSAGSAALSTNSLTSRLSKTGLVVGGILAVGTGVALIWNMKSLIRKWFDHNFWMKQGSDMGAVNEFYKQRNEFVGGELIKKLKSIQETQNAKDSIDHLECIRIVDQCIIDNVGQFEMKSCLLNLYKDALRMDQEAASARPKLKSRLNFLFLGNPGTGKTTAAEELFAKMLFSTGLRNNKYHEIKITATAPTIADIQQYAVDAKKGMSNMISTAAAMKGAFSNNGIAGLAITAVFQGTKTWSRSRSTTNDNHYRVVIEGRKAWEDYEKNIIASFLKATDSGVNFWSTSAAELLMKDNPAAALNKKIQEMVQNDGGVVFIDEAYTLKPASNKKGAQVYALILLASERHKDIISFILAGYKKDIEQELVSFNPGIARRFPTSVLFEDLSDADIREVINMKLRKSRSIATDFVPGWYMKDATTDIVVARLVKRKSFPGFGNFATVNQSYDSAVQAAGARLKLENKPIKQSSSIAAVTGDSESENKESAERSNDIDDARKTPDDSESESESENKESAERSNVIDDARKTPDDSESEDERQAQEDSDSETKESAEHAKNHYEAKQARKRQARIEQKTNDQFSVSAVPIKSEYVFSPTEACADSTEVQSSEGYFKEIMLEDVVGKQPSTNKRLQLLMATKIGMKNPKTGKFGNYNIKNDGFPEFSADGKSPKFIGMDNVKLILQELVNSAEYNWLQESKGLPTVPIMLNKLFIGKPGTGKTEIAILWAEIIKELHLLSDSSFVSKTASDFISNVVGGSQTKTNAILKASMGKVLFIDEAYVLAESQFGLEVLNTIVEQVQAKPGADRSVIMAGYPKEMNAMCRNVNPGLGRRFDSKFPVEFHDYSNESLTAIMSGMAKKHHILLLENARKFAINEIAKRRPAKDFGNAGTVNTFIDKAVKSAMTRCLESKAKWEKLQNTKDQKYFTERGNIKIFGEMEYFTAYEKQLMLDEKIATDKKQTEIAQWQMKKIEFLQGRYRENLMDATQSAVDSLGETKKKLQRVIDKASKKNKASKEKKKAWDNAKAALEAHQRNNHEKERINSWIDLRTRYLTFATTNSKTLNQLVSDSKEILEKIIRHTKLGSKYTIGRWAPVALLYGQIKSKYKKILTKFYDTTFDEQHLLKIKLPREGETMPSLSDDLTDKLDAKISHIMLDDNVPKLYHDAVIRLRRLAMNQSDDSANSAYNYGIFDHVVAEEEIKAIQNNVGLMINKIQDINTKANETMKLSPVKLRQKAVKEIEQQIKNDEAGLEDGLEAAKMDYFNMVPGGAGGSQANIATAAIQKKKIRQKIKKSTEILEHGEKISLALRAFLQKVSLADGTKELALPDETKQLPEDINKIVSAIQTDIRNYNQNLCVAHPKPYKSEFQKLKEMALEERGTDYKNKLQLFQTLEEKKQLFLKWTPSQLVLTKFDFGKCIHPDPIEHLIKQNVDHGLIRYITSITQEYKVCKEIWPKDDSKWPKASNIIFHGNSGTGKTEAANMLGEALKNAGLLVSGETTIRSASDLEGTVVGEAQKLVQEAMEEALGGILLIDEAYELGRSEYGRQAQTKLIAMLEEEKYNNGKLVVILCGYQDKMQKMMRRNQGMASRFGREFLFRDVEPKSAVVTITDTLREEYFITPEPTEPMLPVSGSYSFGADETKYGTGTQVELCLGLFMKFLRESENFGNYRDCKTIAMDIKSTVYANITNDTIIKNGIETAENKMKALKNKEEEEEKEAKEELYAEFYPTGDKLTVGNLMLENVETPVFKFTVQNVIDTCQHRALARLRKPKRSASYEQQETHKKIHILLENITYGNFKESFSNLQELRDEQIMDNDLRSSVKYDIAREEQRKTWLNINEEKDAIEKEFKKEIENKINKLKDNQEAQMAQKDDRDRIEKSKRDRDKMKRESDTQKKRRAQQNKRLERDDRHSQALIEKEAAKPVGRPALEAAKPVGRPLIF
tara:strand:- start:2298 stop:11048 length:8751 start_codon:yes stop_codon:yes gene_type:complete